MDVCFRLCPPKKDCFTTKFSPILAGWPVVRQWLTARREETWSTFTTTSSWPSYRPSPKSSWSGHQHSRAATAAALGLVASSLRCPRCPSCGLTPPPPARRCRTTTRSLSGTSSPARRPSPTTHTRLTSHWLTASAGRQQRYSTVVATKCQSLKDLGCSSVKADVFWQASQSGPTLITFICCLLMDKPVCNLFVF